jgi:hypothetical protein
LTWQPEIEPIAYTSAISTSVCTSATLVSGAAPAPAETTPQMPSTRKNVPTNSEMYAAGPLGSMGASSGPTG